MKEKKNMNRIGHGVREGCIIPWWFRDSNIGPSRFASMWEYSSGSSPREINSKFSQEPFGNRERLEVDIYSEIEA